MIQPALPHVARALALVAAAALAVSAGRADAAVPLRLTIAFTGDVGGYLEPCG